MLTTQTVLLWFSVFQALTAVGLFVVTRWVPERLRRYGYLLAGIVAFGAVDLFSQWMGVGALAVGDGEIQLTAMVAVAAEYFAIYGGVALLGGASRRLAVTVSVVALLPVLLTQLLPVLGLSQVLLLLVIAVGFLLPFPLLTYLFFRPIRATASQLPSRRRLFHRKARNLVLFTYLMVIIYLVLVIAGVVSDSVLQSILLQYTAFIISVGIPVFLVYRLTTDDADEVPTMLVRESGAGGSAE